MDARNNTMKKIVYLIKQGIRKLDINLAYWTTNGRKVDMGYLNRLRENDNSRRTTNIRRANNKI